MSGARIRTGVPSAVDELAELARQLAERVGQAALELLGEDDVAEAVPGVRACRRRAAPGSGARPAAAARGRRGPTVTTSAATHARTEPASGAEDPRLDGEDVERDRRREQQRQRVVADRQPERRGGRGDEPAVAAVARRSLAGALAPSATSSPAGSRRRRRGGAACASAWVADRPGDRRAAPRPMPATIPQDRRAGQRRGRGRR